LIGKKGCRSLVETNEASGSEFKIQ